MNLSEFVNMLTPQVLVQAYRALRRSREKTSSVQRGLCLSGEYSSWQEAMADSVGYNSETILEKTRAALLKVKYGEAEHERDSVLFDEVQYAWPLLAGLMWVAGRAEGRLNVLDFGGSLGSTYFQNRKFLQRLPEVRWNIIEQSHHVGIGKADFEDEHLKFYCDIQACLAETQPNVAVLSSVLQYIEQPFDVLRMLLASPCNHLIVDRTPFWNGSTDRLCVQRVPSCIYQASYPSWIFSKRHFWSHWDHEWETVAEFNSLDELRSPIPTTWKGMIMTRRVHHTGLDDQD